MDEALPSPWGHSWGDDITMMTFREGSIICEIELGVPSDLNMTQLSTEIAAGIENSEVFRSLGVMEAIVNGNILI